MKTKQHYWNKAGDKHKIVLGSIALVVVAMLTLGLTITQYQAAQIQKTKDCTQCDQATYQGDEMTYCYIAHNAITCLTDGLNSGAYDFSELQAYIDMYGVPVAQPVQGESHSYFASVEIPSTPIPGKKTIIDDSTSTPVERFDVVERLRERLPQGEAYCQGGEPADWNFHPEALCLALSLVAPLGVCMATGMVTAFFSLFGLLSYGVGSVLWGLLLRALGVLDLQLIELSQQIYAQCMGYLG